MSSLSIKVSSEKALDCSILARATISDFWKFEPFACAFQGTIFDIYYQTVRNVSLESDPLFGWEVVM